MTEPELTPLEAFPEKFSHEALDRRRAGKSSNALIVRASQALPAPDRALLRAVFEDGRSAAELARMRGLKPRRLSHRIRQLALRVLSPEFTFVAANRAAWGRSRARIATACFLHGLSIRDAARLARVSFHTARQHHAGVLELMRVSRSGAPCLRVTPPQARPEDGSCHPMRGPVVMGGAA